VLKPAQIARTAANWRTQLPADGVGANLKRLVNCEKGSLSAKGLGEYLVPKKGLELELLAGVSEAGARWRNPERSEGPAEYLVPKKGLELELLAGVSEAGACWRNPERSEGPAEYLVPKKGLEPPHPCGYMDLNHARLPIPPLRQVDCVAAAALQPLNQEDQHLHFTGVSPAVKITNRGEPRLGQLCAHGDVGVQHLRDRAAFFCVLGSFVERRGVGLRHARGHIKVDGSNRPT
jgi:hypothetical protein